MPRPRTHACLLTLLLTLAASARAETAVGGAELFEKKVRPVLVRECLSCHGPGKAKGGLRLDSRAGLLRGGDRGPAVDPDDPDRSLLLRAVRHDGPVKMPPAGRLTAAEIADLAAWVRQGVPWPDAPAAPDAHWAFRPLADPAVPDVTDTAWPRTPLDHFVLRDLEAHGLRPAPPADKRTLLRRVTFDLTGLPPTPEETNAFLADGAPDAWVRVVDRLLASPAYGERWGRHWLDVARYADSNGSDENVALAHAWRYRDYVVAAFNADKPFDAFLTEQLAGDLLPPAGDAVNHERLTATGFLVLGPRMLSEPDKQKLVMDLVDEQIDTTSRAFLGLTVSCARCHDHKSDPVPQRDYYALAGVFKSTRTLATLTSPARALERPLGDRDGADRAAAHAKLVRARQRELERVKDDTVRARLRAELDALLKEAPAPVPLALAAQDEARPADVRVHLRGSPLTLGDEVPRGFLAALPGGRPSIPAGHSGRLELARWLTAADNPLTARVFVNRVWQHHFGEGIVRTPDNFGSLGDPPTHPELLDWLARRFVEGGWSVKALHRELLLSSAYRTGGAFDPAAARADPDDCLLWRFPRRRLEAEAIRDSLLSVSGALDRSLGGSLLTVPDFEHVTNDRSETRVRYDSDRRSVYLPVVRNAVCDALQTFDFPDPSTSTGRRAATTVAPQALFFLNSPLVRGQAGRFAARLLARPDLDDGGRVNFAFELAYGRPAEADEVAAALRFLDTFAGRAPDRGRAGAWEALCQTLFAANEFVSVN
jgi:cytochrome c553